MASKLIHLVAHEVPNQLEFSLREAYSLLRPNLVPPLKLTISSTQEYLKLNEAIVYGVLCEPSLAQTFIKYLHAIVNDGYCLFINILSQIVDLLYLKMLESPKRQLIWVASVMIDVSGIGFGGLLVSLLRQIVGGDFCDGNLWLSHKLVDLFMSKWELILDEEPIILSSALYTYLRLLTDHYRLAHSPCLTELKQKEIVFCVRILREQFHLCLRIGRDLVRLLQDLVHIPEFRVIWKDLLLNPDSFKTSGFSDISHIYAMRTSSRYFLLRITPEMETQLQFLLTHVKLGSQKRHQIWFTRKFLYRPERETLISDIVRYVCCAHHPSEEVLQSDVIPKWAVIGWLLKLCTKKYVEANVKLALFYDWLFFDEKVDDYMNIEPTMLLLVNSLPKYIDITNSLLEFLFLVVENYDIDRKNIICKGVSSAIRTLVGKGVIASLDILTSCNLLSPLVKEMLQNFMCKVQSGICKEPHPPENFSSNMTSQTSPGLSNMRIETHKLAGLPACPEKAELNTQPISVSNEGQENKFTKFIEKIKESMKFSSKMGQQSVEDILLLLINSGNEEKFGDSKFLACELKKELELAGYKFFSPIGNLPTGDDADEEVQSVTASVIRTFIISQHQQIKQMLFCWSRDGCSVGARILSYALRLAYEAQSAGHGENFTNEINYKKLPLLKSHIEGYLAFTSENNTHVKKTVTFTSKVDDLLVSKVIDGAFISYRNILLQTWDDSSKEINASPGKLLAADMVSCSLWKTKSFAGLFRSIFTHLPDLSLADEDVIFLLVSQLEDFDLVSIQIDVGLKKYAIFGEDVEKVLQLIRKSLYWKEIHQHKFWALIRSELTVSKFPVEKLLLDCFFSTEFDSKSSATSIGGLLGLCSSCAPTPEIVGAVMLLPNKFADFSAAVLAHWTTTNASMFSSTIEDFLNKFEHNGDARLNWDSVSINQSALLFLMKYFEAQGVRVNMLEKLAFRNRAVPMDTG
ncbi:unnamed protein product [Amaranthus hypochondriacus]